MVDTKQTLDGIIRSIEADVQVTGYTNRKFVLAMDFSNCTVEDVIMLAMSPRRISWANAHRAKGEQHMATLKLNQDVMIMPIGSRGPIDVEAGFMSKMQSASADDLDKKIAELTAMKAKKTVIVKK
jgi:hypothetical protein